MVIAIVKETDPQERRVALVPAHVPALLKAGHQVLVEAGLGERAGYADSQYEEKGAQLLADLPALVEKAEVVCAVHAGAARPDLAAVLDNRHTLIGMMDPYQSSDVFQEYSQRGITAFSLELVPRITRAQSMDVLSSMANLAGYKAVLLAAEALPKMFPMMMTAAGTVTPAKVFVLGAGVSGLQAIATARRLGAVVSAYDIRPAVREQVESLGASFVEISVSAENAESSGGYAQAMDDAFYKAQQEKMLETVAASDVVITTAAVPGRKAPVLVSMQMLDAMQPGSVIVDLAVERGGNVELSQEGKTVDYNGVSILGPSNIASSLARDASQLFSRNMESFVQLLASQKEKEGQEEDAFSDEILRESLLVHRGSYANASLKSLMEGNT